MTSPSLSAVSKRPLQSCRTLCTTVPEVSCDKHLHTSKQHLHI